MTADKLAFGHFDEAADGFECHCAVESGCIVESAVAFVVAQLTVLAKLTGADGLAVEVPEVAFHAFGDGDGTALVVYVGVGLGGFEDDFVALDARCDAFAQSSAFYEYRAGLVLVETAATCSALVEECLTVEVFVELVVTLDFDVAHGVADELLHLLA